ncbi:hypothetical protein JCM10914A_33870 [Paenibacillus sp. JCM 10914]|nr:hypothetical protein [Paenibacillus sp. JCM 10914]
MKKRLSVMFMLFTIAMILIGWTLYRFIVNLGHSYQMLGLG